jgi:outer membrane lipoprotein-sorting protein
MNYRISLFRIGLATALFFLGTTSGFAQTTKKIMDDMLISIHNIHTLRFKLKKTERIDGVLQKAEQEVKFSHTPRMIYTYIHSPNQGVELLWMKGKNDNQVYINPNAFPYVNLNLDPYGSIVRKGNHHTVYEVGFDYIGEIMDHMIKKSGTDFDKYFFYQGEVVFDKRPCYKIVIDYKPFAYVNYTMKANETITSIAYKMFVSDYMILEKNPKIDDYYDVKEGQQVIVPTAYALKTILYVDKENHLPVFQGMYDEKGLFSQYEFYGLQMNQKIEEAEFTKEYSKYNF